MKSIIEVTREEFQNMATKLRPSLLAHAVKLLGDSDAAEDVVQDTLLKMWSMREHLDDYRSPTSLAMVISRNLCLDILKRPSNRGVSLDEARGLISTTPSPHRRLTDREAVAEAMRVMASLPERVQTIMRMRHVEGMETADIAALIGATESSVRVSLSRGRKRMKELFETRRI